MRIPIFGAAMLQLAVLVASQAEGQGRFARMREAFYSITRVYDRVTDSTRVTGVWREGSRRFGLKSRAWFDVSFVYPGRLMTAPPGVVTLTLESFTPSRGGGWAFARPQKLHMRSGRTMELDVPAAKYVKRRVSPSDPGRREMLSFHVPMDQFIAAVAQPELELKAGGASFRLRGGHMEMLQDLVSQMMTSERAP